MNIDDIWNICDKISHVSNSSWHFQHDGTIIFDVSLFGLTEQQMIDVLKVIDNKPSTLFHEK